MSGRCPECGREGRFYTYSQPIHSLGVQFKCARCRNCGTVSVYTRLDTDEWPRRMRLTEWAAWVKAAFADEIDTILEREEHRR